MTERKPPGMSFETWVGHPDLAGAWPAATSTAWPAPASRCPGLDLDETGYEWVVAKARREDLDTCGMLPPGLALRKEREDLPAPRRAAALRGRRPGAGGGLQRPGAARSGAVRRRAAGRRSRAWRRRGPGRRLGADPPRARAGRRAVPQPPRRRRAAGSGGEDDRMRFVLEVDLDAGALAGEHRAAELGRILRYWGGGHEAGAAGRRSPPGPVRQRLRAASGPGGSWTDPRGSVRPRPGTRSRKPSTVRDPAVVVDDRDVEARDRGLLPGGPQLPREAELVVVGVDGPSEAEDEPGELFLDGGDRRLDGAAAPRRPRAGRCSGRSSANRPSTAAGGRTGRSRSRRRGSGRRGRWWRAWRISSAVVGRIRTGDAGRRPAGRRSRRRRPPGGRARRPRRSWSRTCR